MADPLHLRFDEFELDEANARLMRGGQALALAPKAFDLLCALARQPQQLLTKDALLDVVWGHRFVSESVLKTTVSDLRAALGDDARQPRYIETASRRGYRFIARLAVPAAAAPMPTAAAAAPPLIGRQAALERLRERWRRAGSGAQRIVWVSGEAGIGKTTLIDHFAAEVGQCARGQCVEQHGAGEPYLPVLEALAQLCRADPELPGLLRSVAPTWALQLPWLSSEAERAASRCSRRAPPGPSATSARWACSAPGRWRRRICTA